MVMFKQDNHLHRGNKARAKAHWVPAALIILSITMIVLGFLAAFLNIGPSISFNVTIFGVHIDTKSLGLVMAVCGLILAIFVLRHYDKLRPPLPPPPPSPPPQIYICPVIERVPEAPVKELPKAPQEPSSEPSELLNTGGTISIVASGIAIAIIAPEIAPIALCGCAVTIGVYAYRRISERRWKSK